MPYFSIIVPCYNQAHYLGQLVESVRNQSFTDWELLIINDGSTDDTLAMGTSLAVGDPRIRIYTKVNGGLSSARNAGLEHAVGIVIQFLDADDFLLPDALKNVVDFIKAHNSPDIIQVGYQYVNEVNTEVLHVVLPPQRDSLMPHILVNNLGPCHSFFIRKEVTDRIGKFDETLQSAEDWDFWMRAGKVGVTFAVLRKCLVAYRYVASSMSRDAFRMYTALKTVAQRARMDRSDSFGVSESKLNEGLKKHLLTCLGVSVMQGKIDESIQLFKREVPEFSMDIAITDFASMYSYLSFRYWNTPKEVDRIFQEFHPRFKVFFTGIGMNKQECNAALKEVFGYALKFRNHLRFGKLMSSIINKILYS